MMAPKARGHQFRNYHNVPSNVKSLLTFGNFPQNFSTYLVIFATSFLEYMSTFISLT